MAKNILVRNLDDALVKKLKAAAKAHRRSLQAEIVVALHREIDHQDAMQRTREISDYWLKRLQSASDSTDMIREAREEREAQL